MSEAITRGASRAATIPVSAIAWTGVTALFLQLRLGPTWQTPVGGAELVHLSGAWQARVGLDDSRFVPTLFQALTTLLLHFTNSEVPARALAFVATATTPAALYLLRPRLGNAGALLALALLAFDGPAVNLGVSASAMGFDLALTLWFFVALTSRWPAFAWAPIGFLLATAGPVALPLLAATVVVAFLRRGKLSREVALFAVAGVASGLTLDTLRFGLGVDGLRLPPFDLFAAGYDQRWSTSMAVEVAGLSSVPILLGGIAAAVGPVARLLRRSVLDRDEVLLLAWAAVAALWFASSARSHSTVSLVALTTPLALLAGPALDRALAAMVRADWTVARYLLPATAFASALALMKVMGWAHARHVGGADQQALVAGMLLIALAALVMVALSRAGRPTLFAAALAIGVVPFLAGAFGVALGARDNPVPSPFSSAQARQIRDVALDQAAGDGGLVVVHPRFRDDLTWPFRESGSITIASRVPPNAAVAIWPLDLPAPEGMSAVEGRWSLVHEVEGPGAFWLNYVHWYVDRHSLHSTPGAVALYVKASQ